MRRPGRFTHGNDLVPVVQKAGCVPGRCGRMREISPRPVFFPRTVHPSSSLVRKSSIGQTMYVWQKKSVHDASVSRVIGFRRGFETSYPRRFEMMMSFLMGNSV